jgi:hypothetical protein
LTYCDSFGLSKGFAEGAFATTRYYQLEVIKAKEEADPTVFHTPITKRTRAQTQQQLTTKMANLHLQTATRKKPSALSFDKIIAPATPKDLFGLNDDEPSPSPSPFKPISPIPPELENILYPPTKDEQIVNTALVIFLNPLPFTFHYSCTGIYIEGRLLQTLRPPSSRQGQTDIWTTIVESPASSLRPNPRSDRIN